ncbi:TonB-dependent receptor [Roseateles aquatilis]|uniref:TonB-dependent receptor n=1 Tax=Roseateles aquatilis TaxID=431061 RepID=A0A246JH82_9BURK|nr:TonB-dependent receptor [Roseateles aquatilis]OWQ91873.1 TonB-dependent receptor [Roseateles aquatilis]
MSTSRSTTVPERRPTLGSTSTAEIGSTTARDRFPSAPARPLLALLIAATFSPGPASAQTVAEASTAAQAGSTATGGLDAVVVTGTRRIGTTSLDAPAPVDVLTAETLERTGAADLSRALISLSPSFSAPSTPNGGFASSIPAGASLRGLSADEVLVLINGKRRHVGANFTRQTLAGGRGAAAVDLSLIPVSAIDRVEILRDGAAAQYGSDAIAGVINIVLKSQDSGGGLAYRWGGLSHEDRGGEQHTLNGWKGLALPNDGFLTLSFDAGKKAKANNTRPDPSLPVGHPFRDWAFGSPQLKDQLNVVANAELPLGTDTALYAFGTYGQRQSIGENFYESNTANSVLARSVFFQQRFPQGRIPINVYDLDDAALNVGARHGSARAGQWDAALNIGRNTVKSTDRNAINPSYGPDSPSTIYTGSRENTQANATLDYSRDVDVSWLAGPLTIAAGAAYRWERYVLEAGDPLAYTRGPFYNPSQVPGVGVPGLYSGITDQDARRLSRKVGGAYVSAEGQVTERLNVGLALRSEHYSDFGATTNGKVSLRYDFTPRIALRSTASNGYRAPSIVQLGYSAFSVQTATVNGQPVDVQQRTLLPGSPIANLIGGTALRPEKSKNVSLGLVWRPSAEASATIDLYQIDIDQRIALSENLTTAALPALTPILSPFGINSAAFFTNVLDTRTRGAELTGKYRLALGAGGRLDLNAGYAWNQTRITRARDVATASGAVIPSTLIVGRNTRGLIEEITPRDKLVLGADWHQGAWSVNGGARRYGKWTNRATNALDDKTYGAQWVVDAEVAYRFDGALRGLTLAVGAINLFDSYPDENPTVVASTGQPATGSGAITKYSFNSPEGGLGTQLYARLSYSF